MCCDHYAARRDRAYRSTELKSTPEFEIKARHQGGLLCSQETATMHGKRYQCVTYVLLIFCLLPIVSTELDVPDVTSFMEEPIENVRLWQDGPCPWVAFE